MTIIADKKRRCTFCNKVIKPPFYKWDSIEAKHGKPISFGPNAFAFCSKFCYRGNAAEIDREIRLQEREANIEACWDGMTEGQQAEAMYNPEDSEW